MVEKRTVKKRTVKKRMVEKRRLMRGKKMTRRRKLRTKKVKTQSKKRKSLRRKHLRMVGGDLQKYKKLKQLADKILNHTLGYDESYIVGSMAIALHEEDQGKTVNEPYPNDIDIVLPVDGTPGQVQGIHGMTSDNQRATKGATFKDDNNPELSVDVIQEQRKKKKRSNNIVDIADINVLSVLNIDSLKSRYQEIVNAWESDEDEKESAQNKLDRLNILIPNDRDIHVHRAEEEEEDPSSLSRSLFEEEEDPSSLSRSLFEEEEDP